MPKSRWKSALQITLGIVPLLLLFSCCGGFLLFSGPEQIASFRMTPKTTTRIFAEGASLYEPPGYLSIEIDHDEYSLIERYPFMGIGAERVPSEPLGFKTTTDQRYSAVTRYDDAIFMIDFATTTFWPPTDWNVNEFDAETGRLLLNELQSEFPRITCLNLDDLERSRRNRQQSQKDRLGRTKP